MCSGEDIGRESGRECRGQTTLDFAVGVSIFLAVVMFIFLFVPGIVAPFTVGAQDETVTVNRVADGLTQGQLGSPERPGVLRTDCTVDFFEHASAGGSTIDSCGIRGEDLAEFVGVTDRQNVNVTITGDPSPGDAGTEQLCWDGSNGRVVERDSGACGVLLAAGDTPPPNNADSVKATRVALLSGEDITLTVEMW